MSDPEPLAYLPPLRTPAQVIRRIESLELRCKSPCPTLSVSRDVQGHYHLWTLFFYGEGFWGRCAVALPMNVLTRAHEEHLDMLVGVTIMLLKSRVDDAIDAELSPEVGV